MSLAASAVAVVALAVPAHAVGDGTYVIRNLRTGGCLAPLAGPFSPVVLKYDRDCTQWKVTNQEDGSVQLSPTDQPALCLDTLRFPEAAVAPCGEGRLQRWQIDDFGPRTPANIRNLDTDSCLNALSPEGPVLVLSCRGPEWLLEPTA
ncbi:hypothetical protein [Streptacidiphilus sp. EB129]|uniref:hypothetical protein n=1 Tax=Streptacidiphilus sp. EB129 TaxID=3156262 RepID=UPI003511D1D1